MKRLAHRAAPVVVAALAALAAVGVAWCDAFSRVRASTSVPTI
jgi:uncharacterized membrane protein YoaK (UPF0700 family)